MEKIFSKEILELLIDDFQIKTEVYGTHFSGKRLRIDAILKPKDTSKWKNKNISIGIEFKSKEKLDGIKHTTHWIKQCIDYANTKWDNHGYIYVFSCPSILDENNDKIYWNKILSDLGVGRLGYTKYYGWTFYLQDNHRIWSQKDGVIEGKKWSLLRKFGRDSFKNI
ncbi:hypothetical protein [Ferruginibacter sp.]|nr:hypothetical protein [Ferruginibacter sp.]